MCVRACELNECSTRDVIVGCILDDDFFCMKQRKNVGNEKETDEANEDENNADKHTHGMN